MRQWLRIIGYVLTLRCDEADRIRCAPDCAPVTRSQRLAERLHRLVCASCRRAKRQIGALRTVLRDVDDAGAPRPAAAEGDGLRDAARQRLRDAIDQPH